MQKENKVYEVVNYGSQFKIGELILEEDISAVVITKLLKEGIIKEFTEELLFS